MTAIAFTMVYNERENLPRWLRHYGAHVDRLLVLDHGSDDGSTEDLATAERIRVPRSPPDAGLRVALINDMQRHLLRHHAAVALRRLAVTRSMAWTDRALASNSGAHQRQSDAEHTADRFDAVELALLAQGGLARLPATQEVTYFNRCLALEADGFWRVPFFAGRVFGIEPFMRELV